MTQLIKQDTSRLMFAADAPDQLKLKHDGNTNLVNCMYQLVIGGDTSNSFWMKNERNREI